MRGTSIVIYLTLAATATAAAVSADDHAGAPSTAVAVGGSFSITNSRDGTPIFTVTDLAPGDNASGTVEIANAGTETGELTLTQHDLFDTPGLGGGTLSEHLAMQVRDITVPTNPAPVYTGPLASMPPRSLGLLAPEEARSFEFVATLPDGGSSSPDEENSVQGASTSVTYRWTVTEDVATPEASPPPVAPASGSSSTPSSPSGLHLRILRIDRTIRHGRLVVMARCDRPCRIRPRGRVRVPRHAASSARLRPTSRPRFAAGPQRVTMAMATGRRELRAFPIGGLPLRVHIVLSAVDRTGDHATVRGRRTAKLRRSVDWRPNI